MLGKTPSQIKQLEDDGWLSHKERLFLAAWSQWRTEFSLENNVSLF